MQREITGFQQDEVCDWVAELRCHHRQHVRHRPPFHARAWVETAQGRGEHVGTEPEMSLDVRGGESQPIPPGVLHAVALTAGSIEVDCLVPQSAS